MPRPRVPEAEALRRSLRNRLDWSPEYREMIVARIRELEGVASPKLPCTHLGSSRGITGSPRPLMDDPLWRFLLLLTAVLFVLAVVFGGKPSFDGPNASPASPYPQWRPA
jgi:hypothetical protein